MKTGNRQKGDASTIAPFWRLPVFMQDNLKPYQKVITSPS